MLSPVFPFPPSSGALVRISQILQGLAKYHSITFVAPLLPNNRWAISEAVSAVNAEVLPIMAQNPNLARTARALISPFPYHLSLLYEPDMKRTVHDLVRSNQFSLIYLHFLYTLPYVPLDTPLPVVLAPQNVDRSYWRRKVHSPATAFPKKLVAWMNCRKTVRYEDAHLGAVAAYVSVSKRDSMQTKAYAGNSVARFLVAPNGVDLRRFRPAPVNSSHPNIVLGFMGSFDLDLNREAARFLCHQILPAVRSRLPQFQFSAILIGRNPPRSITALGEQDSTIEVTGTVADVVPFLQRVDIMVLPLTEGAGTKLRTIEAMAVGLPVVGTELAFQGIEGAVHGSNILLAATLSDFCNCIAELTTNRAVRDRVSQGAQQLAPRYDWGRITARLASELETVAVDIQKSVPQVGPGALV